MTSMNSGNTQIQQALQEDGTMFQITEPKKETQRKAEAHKWQQKSTNSVKWNQV